jgi:anthranilate synthase component 2
VRILIIDNYDSFTYNLVHYVEKIAQRSVDVYRNDEISPKEVVRYNKIILSPGPGLPEDAGIMKELIKNYASTISIFGVCLGMQAIAEVFGGKLYNLNTVYHGVASNIQITDCDEKIYRNIPNGFEAGRYHSWMVQKESLPECLKITAVDENKQIMSLRHKEFDVCGVQYHPESIMTPFGEKIIRNWLHQ